jgi:hypothetical protein
VRRVLLIANANAHTVTPYAHGVIAKALAAGTRLETVETKRQGHATRGERRTRASTSSWSSAATAP